MKSQCVVAGIIASAIFSLSVVTASATTTTLTDGDFASTSFDTFNSTGSFAFASGKCTACGNPSGPGLTLFVQPISTTSVTASVVNINNALTYNPSVSGAITSINAQYDGQVLTTGTETAFPNFFRLVALQGSGTFATNINLGGTQTVGIYNTLSASNLTLASFALIDGSGLLDFASGGQIIFGVEEIFAVPLGVRHTSNFDNFRIDINSVPLPGALPLFATGLGALGLLGWRRKKKARALAA